MTNDIGYIYIISDRDRGIVKVGKSKNPEKRINVLINTCGIVDVDFFIFNECANHSHVEAKCHKAMSELKVKGEWFGCDLDYAKSVITPIVGNKCLKAKKLEDKSHESDQKEKMTKFTKSLFKKSNSAAYDELFKDTLELVNICNDSSLIDDLMIVNGDITRLLFVRCLALKDVIDQQSELLNLSDR